MKKARISLLLFFFNALAVQAQAVGCVFLNTVDGWQYGGVYVDGEWAGRLYNGFSYFCLDPGSYKITSFKSTSGSRSYRTTRTLDVNINIRVEEGALTSVGTLVAFSGYNSTKVIYLENDSIALEYVKTYYPDNYKTFSEREIIKPTAPYKNKHLDAVRYEYLKKNSVNFLKESEYYAGELGILLDLRGDEPKKIETNMIKRLYPSIGERELDVKVFGGVFGELYTYDGSIFSKMLLPEDVRSTLVAQSAKWVFVVDKFGHLHYSNNFGEKWLKNETRIAGGDAIAVVGEFAGKDFVYGPITHTNGENDYKNLVGYIVNSDASEIKEIKWSKYVTSKSRFFKTNDVLYMDPVTLGNKTFLFYYDEYKNKWREVKLPNRHCDIKANSRLISLVCRKGADYNFAGIGDEWIKTETHSGLKNP